MIDRLASQSHMARAKSARPNPQTTRHAQSTKRTKYNNSTKNGTTRPSDRVNPDKRPKSDNKSCDTGDAKRTMSAILERLERSGSSSLVLTRCECLRLFNNLTPGATGEIKSLYLRLCLIFHPDHANGRPTATTEFQILSRAYTSMQNNKFDDDKIDVSSDDDDMDDDAGTSDDRDTEDGNVDRDDDTEDHEPRTTTYYVPLTLMELFTHTAKSIETCRTRLNAQRDKLVTVTDTFTIFVPPGIADGAVIICMPSMGSWDGYVNKIGDLVFRAKVTPCPDVERRDADLIVRVTIPLHKVFDPDRTLVVPLFGGQMHKTVRLPANVWHGQTLKFPGDGLPIYQDPTTPESLRVNLGNGTLEVHLTVQRPEFVHPKIIEWLKQHAVYQKI